MDSAWIALALALTAVSGWWTLRAYRSRGLTAALRPAGVTLLPMAALMTGTLELLVDIGVDIGDWAVGLVLSPVVWIGIILAGASVVLLGAGTVMGRRSVGPAPERPELPSTKATRSIGKDKPAIDDDLAEIEAILKRRGIS